MDTPATPAVSAPTSTPAATPSAPVGFSMQDAVASRFMAAAEPAVSAQQVAVPEQDGSIATSQPAPATPRGPDGRFLPKVEAATAGDAVSEPVADAAPAAPVAASEPMYKDPEYGEIPLSELPNLINARIEFERSKYTEPVAQKEQHISALQKQLADTAAQTAELRTQLDSLVYLAQNDVDGLVNFLRSPAVVAGYQPQAQQAAQQQPPQNYLTREQAREEAERVFQAKIAELGAKQIEQQKQAEMGQRMNALMQSYFPKEVLGDTLQRRAIQAVIMDVHAAEQRGEFPATLPPALADRKLAAICSSVRQSFNDIFVQRAQKQSAVTASVPQPVTGGATPMPKVAPQPIRPPTVEATRDLFLNRIAALSNQGL